MRRAAPSASVPGIAIHAFPQCSAGYLYAGDAGCPAGGFHSSWKQFAPRLGVSYNPGGGQDRDPRRRGPVLSAAVPRSVQQHGGQRAVQPAGAGLPRSVRQIRTPSTPNPFPAQFAPQFRRAMSRSHLPLSLAVSYQRDWKPSRVMNWNFTVERQMAGDVLVRGSYVGIQGHAPRTTTPTSTRRCRAPPRRRTMKTTAVLTSSSSRSRRIHRVRTRTITRCSSRSKSASRTVSR